MHALNGILSEKRRSDKPKRLGYAPVPTLLRLGQLRVVIYLNDHEPAHVHVIGPDMTVVIDLVDLTLREAIGCSEREGRRILRLIAEHREALLEAWRRWHG